MLRVDVACERAPLVPIRSGATDAVRLVATLGKNTEGLKVTVAAAKDYATAASAGVAGATCPGADARIGQSGYALPCRVGKVWRRGDASYAVDTAVSRLRSTRRLTAVKRARPVRSVP